jgi:hypothetical protein
MNIIIRLGTFLCREFSFALIVYSSPRRIMRAF